jgi:hypothetical protein
MVLPIFAPELLVKSARVKLRRWETNNPHPSPSTRGHIMAQYLVFKLNGKPINDKLKKDGYIKVNKVLEKSDLKIIAAEMKKHRLRGEEGEAMLSHRQILVSRIEHHVVSEMILEGAPFLHSWVNELVKEVFLEKTFYDAYYLRNKLKNTRKRRKAWKECIFHLDVEGPLEWNFTDVSDKSPLTIYIPLGDTPIALDLQYKPTPTKRGRPRNSPVGQLVCNPGDIVMFVTTEFVHRSATPPEGVAIPDRMNILLSGFKEAMEITSVEEL